MTIHEERTLGPAALAQFQQLRPDAVRAVTDRFFATHAKAYERFGARGREATSEDLAFHLEFLRPALEFGLLQPMVDYLRWLASVLEARAVPVEHLAISLEWLAEFFEAHMTAEDGAVVSGALHAARRAFLAADKAPVSPKLSHEPWPETAPLVDALLAGSQPEALAVVTGCMDRGKSLVDVERHVIQPAMYRIGEKWQANEVSVAQEHLASAIVQVIMTVGLLRSTPQAATNRRILLACVAGNDHSIGLRMVADTFQLAGWDVEYLGANVPTSALVRQVAEWKPDLVGLSVSFAQQLPVVKDVIARLDALLGAARPGVMIGGLAINAFQPLAVLVRADAVGVDAQEALATAAAMPGRGAS